MKYDKEFLSYVNPILKSKEFQKRKKYAHHENLSVYDHCLDVAYKSYLYAKKHNLNCKDISIGGLLHDFYYEPWQNRGIKKTFFKMHGFVHAREALENAMKHYPELINDRVSDIILRHMFPLNLMPPKYKESWVVTMIDKLCSLEVLKHPRSYPKYLGFNKKKKE